MAQLHHNCGIVGFFYPKGSNNPEHDINSAMMKLQSRGQEGAGQIFIDHEGQNIIRKREGLVRSLIETHSIDKKLLQKTIRATVGQTRYSTSGTKDAWQPFVSENLIISHNGNMVNPISFLKKYSIPVETVFSDTHALFLSLEKIILEKNNFEEALQEVLPQIEGAASLVICDPKTQNIYGYRDRKGIRPLYYVALDTGDGFGLVSETYAIKEKARTLIEIFPGECVRINEKGLETIFSHSDGNYTPCIFELMYFGNPLSEMFHGISIGEFRRECGRWLAREDNNSGFVPDLIVPIRNSGTFYTEGYSQEIIRHMIEKQSQKMSPECISNLIPLSVLITNQNAPRIFITPRDVNKHDATKEKFSLDETIVKGKKVVLVDDSIVRGPTMKYLVSLFKRNGASEVHVRIGSAPVKHPCFFGIDFPDQKELIASDHTISETMKLIGADSLIYMPIKKSVEIAQSLQKFSSTNFCTACFTGDKPYKVNRLLLLPKK